MCYPGIFLFITNCTFNDTYEPDDEYDGTGIYSFDSGFVVNGLNTNFQNLHYAIRAANGATSLVPYHISQSKFENNYHSIFSSEVDNVFIVDNEIIMDTNDGTTGGYFHGIHIYGGTGFQIEENNILTNNGPNVERGIEHPVNPGTGLLYWNGLFYKLDAAGNVVWETPIHGSRPFSTADRFTRMVSCTDGSGYVACGTKLDTFTIDGVFESGRFGWLAKISPQGDSLWSRYYSYVHPANAHSQTFYDLKETSDGGFIMAGESKELITVIGYPQSGWLVKVDQYGCLVPGCHLVNTTFNLKRHLPYPFIPILPVTFSTSFIEIITIRFQKMNLE